MGPEKELIFLECEICNKQWLRIPNKKNKYSKTCSAECFKKLMSKIRSKNKIEKTCPVCGKIFFTSKIKNRKTCSHACAYFLIKLNTKYIKLVCETCGKVKYINEKRYDYYKNTKGPRAFTFCSIKCSLKSVISGLETKIIELLDTYKIEYTKQYQINRFHYDFFIPSKNVLIECQGDYWHGNENVFKQLSEKQLKTKEKDKRKEKLALDCGYKILYFWEYDVYNNISHIISLINEHCV
jgi:very-short-patch-repair endonuclease